MQNQTSQTNQWRLWYVASDRDRSFTDSERLTAMGIVAHPYTAAEVSTTHVMAGTVPVEGDAEDVFRFAQWERYLGEDEKDLRHSVYQAAGHSSMSCGDICENVATGEFFECMTFGFRKLA